MVVGCILGLLMHLSMVCHLSSIPFTSYTLSRDCSVYESALPPQSNPIHAFVISHFQYINMCYCTQYLLTCIHNISWYSFWLPLCFLCFLQVATTIPMYGYNRILYGCMMGTDHMFIQPYRQKLRGQPAWVWGSNGQYTGVMAIWPNQFGII